jgi:regulator-associated protein of mTOR
MRGAYIPGSTPVPPDPPAVRNYIQLAACDSPELLPMNSELPADLFTSCLTTPIKTALRLYILQKTNRLRPNVTVDLVDKIPGRMNDRRTPLGELNWIFTAITDTIAWNTLPRELFHQLFRQDLLVASLFRNFLLADRIMRTYNCIPKSTPLLPSTHQHSLWQAWDLALDLCLPQIPALLEGSAPYQSSPFFTEQLTAFQVWLALGSNDRQPPEQLPIVLQVLLSQVHRVRALELLGKFLDMGPWAVNEALSVGIFPYVLKLLQSTARELRHLLVFVWAKILAVDSTCQSDLVKDGTHRYFLSVLSDPYMPVEHRIHAAFVLSQIVSNHIQGQEACLQGQLISTCLEQLLDPQALLRQWLAICLGRIWRNYEAAKWVGVRDSAHEKLFCLLGDSSPEVRTAAVFALGTFIGVGGERNDHANSIDNNVASRLLGTATDGSPLVREELVVALHGFVTQFESTFMSVAAHMQEDERQKEENARNLQGISTSLNPTGDWVMVHTDYTSSNTPNSDPLSTQTGDLGSSPSQKAGVMKATSASELQAISETEPVLRTSSATAVPVAKASNSTSSSSLGSNNSSPSTFGDFLRRSPMFGFNSVYINTWKVQE